MATCLLVAACGGGSSASDNDDASPSTAATHASDGFEPPPGKVVFDLAVSSADRDPAVDSYVAWQRAATTSLRDRTLTEATRRGAAEAPVETVERSLSTVEEADYTVPRRMVGRLQSIRSTPRAAILGVCLWSPTFDYRERASGERVADRPAHWMGVEVRMSRRSGQDGGWSVAGLSTREDCEGNRP
ncbi:hypothetical protein [Solicola gregarius]|uniref:Uncharacterized protein n=1 Tax=Solicola gregarius TaxID=2908642 RepID=A0AA46TK06_9ACTN|nr:hypothetical protein [Solicola gregarius]UYM06685.1 hypothetical protein L0C25_06335 [Solicola gregarius]